MFLLSQNRMIYFLEMILNDILQSKTKVLHAQWSFGTNITVLPHAPTVSFAYMKTTKRVKNDIFIQAEKNRKHGVSSVLSKHTLYGKNENNIYET